MTRAMMMTVLISHGVWAAAPALIPFQARLSDSAGVPVDGPITMRFRLYSTATPTLPGDVLFEETKTVTARQGSVNTMLGDATALDLLAFSSRDTVYVGVRVGTDVNDLQPLFRLATAPWAAHANTCGNAVTVGGQPETSFLRTTYVPQWSSVQGIPATLADGVDNDSFAALSCADGQHPRRSGTSWVCSDSFTRTEADNRFTRLTSCYWQFNSNCPTIGQLCVVICDSGDHVVSGGCDGNGTGPAQLMESFPGPSSGNFKSRGATGPWPFGASPTDPLLPVIDQWTCRSNVGKIDSAYAFCCPAR